MMYATGFVWCLVVVAVCVTVAGAPFYGSVGVGVGLAATVGFQLGCFVKEEAFRC